MSENTRNLIRTLVGSDVKVLPEKGHGRPIVGKLWHVGTDPDNPRLIVAVDDVDHEIEWANVAVLRSLTQPTRETATA